MGKKLPTTPRSRVRAALRQVWLRSRERQAALKRAKYCCERCGVKASVAKGRVVKLQVHHKGRVTNWNRIIDTVFEELLCDPQFLEVLCIECHDKEHSNGKTDEV